MCCMHVVCFTFSQQRNEQQTHYNIQMYAAPWSNLILIHKIWFVWNSLDALQNVRIAAMKNGCVAGVTL